MDWKYLFTIPSFLVGLFVGFQFIYKTYDEDPFRAAITIPGLLYLGTRGFIPVGVYVLLYSLHLMPQPLWLWSLVCGTAGTELILRTRILVKEERSKDGNIHELMRGPLDLLRWYQSLFLESIGKRLPTYRGEYILRLVKGTIPDDMNFVDMCDKIKSNAYMYQPKNTILYRIRNRIYQTRRETHQVIEQSVNECLADYQSDVLEKGQSPLLESAFKRKLGYIIIDLPRVGGRGLKLLIS